MNVEPAQAMRENVESAMRAILGELASRARTALRDGFLDEAWPSILAKHGPAGALGEALARWSEADPKPLVLLVDEIDALVGDTLLSVLRQLRAGYDLRPAGFPQSVVLCGVRDVRDYRIRSGAEKAVIAGGSAFNVKARSMRLGDFSRDDVTALLAQHTGETGQAFDPAALETIWAQTRGQPWLVNALADETCFRDAAGRDRNRTITADDVTAAAQEGLVEELEWYVDADGGLDVVKLLAAFQAFFREHAEHWVARFDYQEAGPQLLLQAFLQRVVNGGGRIEREYGLGRGRTDLLIVWPQRAAASGAEGANRRRTRKFVVECKVLHKSLERAIRDGLQQTAAYMDRCAADAGHLVIFDRSDRAWEEKVFHRRESAGGVDVHVWGM